jgi:hypothetical protein
MVAFCIILCIQGKGLGFKGFAGARVLWGAFGTICDQWLALACGMTSFADLIGGEEEFLIIWGRG